MAKKKKKKKRKLNPKQRLFCHEYAKDRNATQAAIRAGYAENSANRTGSRLLTNDDIKSYADELCEKHLEKIDYSAEAVLREMARIAMFDPKKLFDDNGDLIPVHELDDDTARALASIEIEALYEGFGSDREQVGHTKKVKLWNKENALKTFMQYHGMLINKHEHGGVDGESLIVQIMLPDNGRGKKG